MANWAVNAIVAGYSRAASLARFFTDYQQLSEPRSPTNAPVEAPPPPLEKPARATHNPHYGSRSLLTRISMQPHRRKTNIGTVPADGPSSVPVAPKTANHERLEPIPRNHPNDVPIQPPKVNSRRFPHSQVVTKNRNPRQRGEHKPPISPEARQAYSMRFKALSWILRTNGADHVFSRRIL